MSGPSFLRRQVLCRLDLCNLWRREGGSRGGYECTGCGRLSMLHDAPKPPSPGPAELHAIASSLDTVPDSLERPLIGYLSKAGHVIFGEDPNWWTALYRDPADLNAKGAIVEVEIRVLRVIPEGAR